MPKPTKKQLKAKMDELRAMVEETDSRFKGHVLRRIDHIEALLKR